MWPDPAPIKQTLKEPEVLGIEPTRSAMHVLLQLGALFVLYALLVLLQSDTVSLVWKVFAAGTALLAHGRERKWPSRRISPKVTVLPGLKGKQGNCHHYGFSTVGPPIKPLL